MEPKRQSRISMLVPEMQRIVTRVAIEVAKSSVFRKGKVLADVFETFRTKERQQFLLRNGKSWTMDSYHRISMAADIVLAQKSFRGIVGKVWRYFWGKSPLYDELSRIMVRHGLRSYGSTYGMDIFHCELPVIFQGSAPHCYAYVVMNGLQKRFMSWRTKETTECYRAATKIQEIIRERRMLPSVKSGLQVAQELGYINKWEKVNKDKWKSSNYWQENNDKTLIISQKRVGLGKTAKARWEKHRERLKNGLGIANHTSLFGFAQGGVIYTRNSHKEFPSYALKDTSQIMSVYEIIN